MNEISYCIRQYQEGNAEYFVGAATGTHDVTIVFDGYYIGFDDNSLYAKQRIDELYKGETIEEGFACAINEDEYSLILNLIRANKIHDAYQQIEAIWTAATM